GSTRALPYLDMIASGILANQKWSLTHMRGMVNLLVAAVCGFAAWGLFWTSLPAASGDDLPKVEKATHKGYTEKIPGSDVQFEMVPIPGGTFMMGSPDNEPGRKADEGPVHPVSIRPFWMGKCEVTWDEYDLWWKANPGTKLDQMDAEKKGDRKEMDALSRPTPPYSDETFGHGRENQPVLGISHHAAMEYCRWLSEKTGKAYRLATEAEWEWACRAGTKTAYYFGDDPKDLKDHAWFAETSEDVTHKVATKKPNPWGLYDMYGNVAEWCLDHYQADFYKTLSLDKPSLAPINMPTTARFSHIVRGGTWADKAPALRSAARRGSELSWIKQDPQKPKSIWWLTDADFVGIRLVRAVEEQEPLKGLRSKILWSSK